MQEQEFKALLEKYAAGIASEEEISWLENAYLHWNEADKVWLTEEQMQAAQNLMRFVVEAETRPIGRFKLWSRIIGIAAAVAAITFGIWFYANEVNSLRKDSRKEEVA